MAYIICTKNLEGVKGTILKLVENQSDLQNTLLPLSNYKVIEISQENFQNIKYGLIHYVGYNGDSIIFDQAPLIPFQKENLSNYINDYKYQIKRFTDYYQSHPLFNRWNSYLTQLNNLNLDNIPYPLNISLEQYFDNLGQPSFNPLQLP